MILTPQELITKNSEDLFLLHFQHGFVFGLAMNSQYWGGDITSRGNFFNNDFSRKYAVATQTPGRIQGGRGTFAPPPKISRHSEENRNVLCIFMFLILFWNFLYLFSE